MLQFSKRKILDPVPGCPWADTMVLNPAMIADPQCPERIHMLFRASGPWNQAALPTSRDPYPIFLGYAVSTDGGEHWTFDLDTPALAPRLEYDRERFVAASCRRGRMFDYANGCIEDPRLFWLENQCWLTVACRAFPPGPYWAESPGATWQPDWVAAAPELGEAVTTNATVSLLYRVDLAALAARRYDQAFVLVAPLHVPEEGDDRDVMLFPRRLTIDGVAKYVCLQRPKEPWRRPGCAGLQAPSIFLALGDKLTDFYDGTAERHLFAEPLFPWEANRIGASWPPIELSPGRWLLPYHGKQDDVVGYTQSFMLLEEQLHGLPRVVARPAARLLYADQPWEFGGEFTVPCLFSCSGLVRPDGTLLMGYGAADKRLGLVSCRLAELVAHLETHSS